MINQIILTNDFIQNNTFGGRNDISSNEVNIEFNMLHKRIPHMINN